MQKNIHTVLEAEKEAFTNHVNVTLEADEDLKSRLPIPFEEVFDAVDDGVILCKLINAAVPGIPTISPAAINLKPTNTYHKIENLNLAIESSRAIGCTVVNVQSTFILEKRQHIVLGLIWQIIRIHISNSITLKRHPEIYLLKKEDEEHEDMQKMHYEDILKRWLNYHIKKAGSSKKVINNLGNDMVDGDAYGCVFQNISESFDKSYWEKSKEERSQEIINYCKKQDIDTTIKADDITSGNPRLNTILCVNIFNEKHGLHLEEIKVVEMPPEKETDETKEMRIFKNWINSQGIDEVHVNYLLDDLRDGRILLKVIDELRPKSVDWKRYSDKSKSRIHIIQNCNYVVDLSKELGLSLVGIGGTDIVEAKVSLTLSVVWQLCALYWRERLGKTPDSELVEWGNERVPEEHRIKGFRDEAFKNCEFLLHLIDSLKKGTVDFERVPKGEEKKDQIARINYTISSARKLGCQIIALWEHINENTTKYTSLFVAELRHISKKM